MIVDRHIWLELRRTYGSLATKLVEYLKIPPRRLYLRVNTLKTTRGHVIDLLNKERILAYPDEFVEDAVFVEIEGPFEIRCNSSKRIVVDDKTASSILIGAHLYRPGVLKADQFNKNEEILVVSRKNIPIACIETVVSYREVLYMDKGLVGLNKSSPFRAPQIAEIYLYKHGLIYPQSLPSIVTTHILDPRPGELIVDMNASPGGKSSHIVQLARGKAKVISIDRNQAKVDLLLSTLTRLGLNTNIFALSMDSRYVHLDLNLINRVDKVLIDPPCSNLGVRPLLHSDKSMKEVIDLSNYQRQFIKAAYHVLKPGGRLVYSTCTITRRENEDNILFAIQELGFEIVELDDPPPYSTRVSIKGVVGYRYSPLYMDMPGYFIAVLSK
ncbi:MAG: PUA domain-containing protein [Desulfurococcaceae archaeon]